MKKRKKEKSLSVEFNTIEALHYSDDLVEYYDISDGSSIDTVTDTIELEKFIHFLPKDEVLFILLKHMGYGSGEIMKILNIKNRKDYYDLIKDLKTQSFLFQNLHKNTY